MCSKGDDASKGPHVVRAGLTRFSENAARLGAAMRANENGVFAATENILQTLG